MDTSGLKVPTCVDEVDAAWFGGIFDGLRSVKVLDVIHGTATKIHVELGFDAPRAPDVQRVWVKSGMEPHSQTAGLQVVYQGETLFYREFAGQYETRTPTCFYAASDDKGHSVVVLDDLLTAGARFIDLVNAGSPEFVARALETIARYQAASWMAPELYANDWLRSGGSHYAYDLVGWLYNAERWERYSRLARFDRLPPALRDRQGLALAHRRVLEDYCRREPWALCHGDCHFGQAYVLPSGEVRLLDWQSIQIAHWAHDVAYFMTGALSVADRRASERDLLAHYRAKLREFGVADVPSEADVWLGYRTMALHGIGWVMCPPEMQPEENCATMTERFATAVIDLDSLGAIGSW